MKDEHPYWLEPSFNPNKAKRLDLRRWLSMYDTPLPSTDLKKDVLVLLFQKHIGSKRETLWNKFHTPIMTLEASQESSAKEVSPILVSTDDDDEEEEEEDIEPLSDIPVTIEFPKKVLSTPSIPSSNSGSETTTPRGQIKPTPSPSPPFYATRSSQSSTTTTTSSSSASSTSPPSPTPRGVPTTHVLELRSNRRASPLPPSRTTKNSTSPSPSTRKGVYFVPRSRLVDENTASMEQPASSERRSTPEPLSSSGSPTPTSTMSNTTSKSSQKKKEEERRHLFTYPSHTLDQARRNSKNFFQLSALRPSMDPSQIPSPTGNGHPTSTTGRPSFFRTPKLPLLWAKTFDFLFWCGKIGFLFLLAMLVLIYFHSRNAIGYCDQSFVPSFSDDATPMTQGSSSLPSSVSLSPSDSPSLLEENRTDSSTTTTLAFPPSTAPLLHLLWTTLFPSCTPCPLHARCAQGRAVSCPDHYVLKQVLWNRWHCAPDTERRKNIDLLLEHLVTHLQVEAGQRICEDTSEWFSYVQVQQFSQHLSEKLWRGKKKEATLYHAIVMGELFTQPLETVMVNQTLITARYPTLPWRCSFRRLFHHHGPHLLALFFTLLTTMLLSWRHHQQKKQQQFVDRMVHHILDLLITQDQFHQSDPSRPSFLGIAAIKLQTQSAYLQEPFVFERLWHRVQTQLSSNPNVRWRTTKHKGEMIESWEWIGFDSLVPSSSLSPHRQRRQRLSARDPMKEEEEEEEEDMNERTWKKKLDPLYHPKRSSTI